MRHSLLAAVALLLPATAIAQDDAPAAEDAEAAEAEPAGPVSYTIDSGKSFLAVRTYKEGIGSAVAHNHAIRAKKTTGTITWGEGGAGCAFDVTVDVPSMAVDADADRKRLGLEGSVSADQRAEIQGNMLAAGQLNAAAHKSMRFQASDCTEGSVRGTLTIVGKGVSKKVPLKVTTEGDALRARGKLELKHTEFGIEPYSAAFGAIRNGDRLTMTIDLHANK